MSASVVPSQEGADSSAVRFEECQQLQEGLDPSASRLFLWMCSSSDTHEGSSSTSSFLFDNGISRVATYGACSMVSDFIASCQQKLPLFGEGNEGCPALTDLAWQHLCPSAPTGVKMTVEGKTHGESTAPDSQCRFSRDRGWEELESLLHGPAAAF